MCRRLKIALRGKSQASGQAPRSCCSKCIFQNVLLGVNEGHAESSVQYSVAILAWEAFHSHHLGRRLRLWRDRPCLKGKRQWKRAHRHGRNLSGSLGRPPLLRCGLIVSRGHNLPRPMLRSFPRWPRGRLVVLGRSCCTKSNI